MNNKIQGAFNILLTVILLIGGFSQFSSNKTLAVDLSCSKIVQGRSVPTNSDLSNITIGLQYGGEGLKHDLQKGSMLDIISIFNKDLHKLGSPYTLISEGNIIYISGSDSSPLDWQNTKGERIEIYMYDNNSSSYIINLEPERGSEYMMYDTVSISSNNCNNNNSGGVNSCSISYQAAWELDQADIDLMATVGGHIHRSYNGSTPSKTNEFHSIQDVVDILNTTYSSVGFVPTFAYDGNIIYIIGSDTEPVKDEIKFALGHNIGYTNGEYIKINDQVPTDYGQEVAFTTKTIGGQDCKNTCKENTIQGWKINGSDFSNIRFEATYNGDYFAGGSFNSIDQILQELNLQAEKYHQEKNRPLFLFVLSGNNIYLSGTDYTPLDPNHDAIELLIKNENDGAYIIDDINETDGGYNNGLMYSDQTLSDCNTVPPINECSVNTTVQGWSLQGIDFSNITFYGSSSNGYEFKKDFTSQADLLDHLNTNFAPKSELNYTFTIKDNILYIVDSDKKPLDNTTEFIEIAMLNRNDNNWIISPSNEDGGKSEGLLYSNQKITTTSTDCNNTCTPKNIQGRKVNGTDFSNNSVQISYNGEIFLKIEQTNSIVQLLETINKGYHEYATANSLPIKTFHYDSDANAIYIVDSDIYPLDMNTEKIELIIIDQNNDGYMVLDKNETDGGYNQGLLYSTQSIAPCNNLPAPQQSIEEIICSGNMVGYDIQLLPTDFFFHGIQDRLLSYDNHTPIGIIANDTGSIQSFLDSIYGTNKVIWYLNNDNTITVWYDTSLDTNNIVFLIGNESDIKEKIQAIDPTTHSICSSTVLPQPILNTEAICIPNTIDTTGQIITCTFTITNNGSGNAKKLTYNGITLPNGFVVSGEGSRDATDLLPGEFVQYTVIGNQTILPSTGTESLIIGDLNATYEDPINGIESITAQTSIQVSTIIHIPDTIQPTIFLLGSGVINALKDSNFSDSGAEWIDNEDGTGIITVATIGTVNTGILGSYILEYQYTDKAGNISNKVSRVVNIIPNKNDLTINNNNTINNNTTAYGGGGGNTVIYTQKNEKSSIVIQEPLQSVHFVAQKNSNALNSSCSYEESIPLESFIDINNSIYSKDIKNLINKCIIHGLEDTFITYGPTQTIKKSEAIKIIARWYKLPGAKQYKNTMRRKGYLSSMQNIEALSGLEKTWNSNTMDEVANRKDIKIIIGNINPDSNMSIIEAFKSKRVSRENFAHFITHQ